MNSQQQAKLKELQEEFNKTQAHLDELEDQIWDMHVQDRKENPGPPNPINNMIRDIYRGAIKEQLGTESFLVQWGNTTLITPKFRPQSQSIITNLSEN